MRPHDHCSFCGEGLPIKNINGFCSEECRRYAAQEMAADLATEVEEPPTDEELSNDARSPY